MYKIVKTLQDNKWTTEISLRKKQLQSYLPSRRIEFNIPHSVFIKLKKFPTSSEFYHRHTAIKKKNSFIATK